jgi:hypothetical protein
VSAAASARTDWRAKAASWAVYLPLLSLFMALLTLSTHIRLRVILGDEGVTCVNAWRLMTGQAPGKDFFEIIPPLSFSALSFLFRLLGPTLFASRVLAFAYGLLLLLLIALLSRRLLASPVARALPVAFLIPFGVGSWPIPSHHWLVDVLQLGALLALLLAIESRPVWWSLLAGALSGLAVLSLQDQGLYWIASATFLLLVTAPRASRRSLALGWFGGGAAILGAAALWLIPGTGLSVLLHDWIILPLTHYSASQGGLVETGAGWREVFRAASGGSFRQSPVFTAVTLLSYALVFALPVLAAISLVALIRGRHVEAPRLALLAAAGCAFAGGALHRLSIMNLVWAAGGLLPLVASHADAWTRSPRAWQRRSAYGFCGGVLALCLLFGALRNVQVMRGPVYQVSAPAGVLTTLRAAEASAVQEAVDAIARSIPPGGPMFTYGFVPLIGFLTEHPNPTRYTVMLTATGYNSAEQGQRWIGQLESANIQWGVGPRGSLDSRDPAARYLIENFVPVWQNSSLVLWKRRSAGGTTGDPGRGTPDG